MASSAVRFTSADKKQLNKGRKRKLNIAEWKDIKRKSLRDSGQPYISKRNVAIPGKIAVDDVRVCSCKYECQNITLANKQKIFKNFYDLNYDNQTRMLAQQCMDIVNIKRRKLATASDSILKRTRNPAYIKILPQKDMDYFRSYFPRIVHDLTTEDLITDVPEVNKRLIEVMNFNVDGGKLLRAAILIAVYKFIGNERKLSKENISSAIILSWCVEMMSSFFLMMDDIIDNSETRRGKTCWFKKENVGLNAINDGVLIQMSLFKLLKKYFSTHKYYQQIVDIFLEVNLKTFVGQVMDSDSCSIENFSRDRYHNISDNKTGYYTFYFPVALASYLADRPNLHLQRNVFKIFMELGRFYQYQNDYMDCYGECYSGKIGTDIQEGKCTWLILSALEKASTSQKKVLKHFYGKWDTDSVNTIKNIYCDLNIKNSFDVELDNCRNRINYHLHQIKDSPSWTLLFKLTEVLLGNQEYLHRD